MSNSQERHHKDIIRLIKAYKELYFWQKWFFPTKLKRAIESNATDFKIYKSFVNDVWVFHQLFFKCLDTFFYSSLALACMGLEREGLLREDGATNGQANFDAIAGHVNPMDVCYALIAFNHADLLSGESAQAYRDAIAGHADPIGVAGALSFLKHKGFLNGKTAQAYRNAIAVHPDPRHVTEALGMLNNAGLLSAANLNIILGCADPSGVTFAFYALLPAGLLNGGSGEANLAAIAGHANLFDVACVLNKLARTNLVSQANFDALIEHTPILFDSNVVVREFWNRLPGITQEQFRAIIDICTQHTATPEDGRRAFIAYVNQILGRMGPIGAPEGRGLLADRQSTHTASVHASVSESAKRLMLSYGSQIKGAQLNQKIADITKVINGRPTLTGAVSEPLAAAKRCLSRMNTPSSGLFDFTDTGSNINTKQLLALVWIAMCDDSKRCSGASKEDGITALIQGLYQIQRGYNLSATGGFDDGQPDSSICMAGTFNKLVESLVSIHPAAEIKLITKQVAELRLQAVVKEQIITHLKGLPKPNTPAEQKERNAYIESVTSAHGMKDEIWDAIKPAVMEAMFAEFGGLYDNRRNHPDFMGLIDTGEYVCVTETELQQAGILPIRLSSSGHPFFPSATNDSAAAAAAASASPSSSQL